LVHVHTSSCCAVPLLAQCRVCEYAGCIWIVVVIVVPNASAITAKVIVMVNFALATNSMPHTYSFLLHFLGNLTGLSMNDVKCYGIEYKVKIYPCTRLMLTYRNEKGKNKNKKGKVS
jgi:hypothetical protein